MSKQRNREEKIPVVPLYSGPVKVLAIPPLGRAVTMALWRAKDKPPVELVVANLVLFLDNVIRYSLSSSDRVRYVLLIVFIPFSDNTILPHIISKRYITVI